jgi:predicted small metal-binding protein
MLSKAQWKGLIHSGLKMPDYVARRGDDLESSHLCGNHGCCNPYHLIPESHIENMRRVPCHKDDRCSCKQQVRCEVGQSRSRIDDVGEAWNAALLNARAHIYDCPVAQCGFQVADRVLSVTEVGDRIAKHVDRAHGTSIVNPIEVPSSSDIVVPDSQADLPEPLSQPAQSARPPLQPVRANNQRQFILPKKEAKPQPAKPRAKPRRSKTKAQK